MALTRDFCETIKEKADKSKSFRIKMLKGAVSAIVNGEPDVGRITLRDYVKATIGFEELARQLEVKSPSLKRMLGPNGNPKTNNLVAILEALQKHEGVTLTVGSHSTAQPKQTF